MGLQAFLSFVGLGIHAPPPTTCTLPGCERPCYVENQRVHDFCGRTHAAQHRQTNQPSGQGSARRSRFDGTQEYTSDGLVLFWQPPSVFSQWTPSRFLVEEVSP